MSGIIKIGVLNLDSSLVLPTSLGIRTKIEWVEADKHTPMSSGLAAVVINTSKPLPESGGWLDKKTLPPPINSFYFNLAQLGDPAEAAYFVHKLHTENSINFQEYIFVGEAYLPTEYGEFQFFGFKNRVNDKRVLGVRTLALPAVPTVRMHSMCYTGDIFHSLKCDCREEFVNALTLIQKQGGMLIYPEEEGRGIGILNKISVYQHQHRGLDTVEAQYADDFPNDLRNYDYLKNVFRYYKINQIRLITNNPHKCSACFKAGVHVQEVVRLPSTVTKHNEGYLKTKNEKSGHNVKLAYTGN